MKFKKWYLENTNQSVNKCTINGDDSLVGTVIYGTLPKIKEFFDTWETIYELADGSYMVPEVLLYEEPIYVRVEGRKQARPQKGLPRHWQNVKPWCDRHDISIIRCNYFSIMKPSELLMRDVPAADNVVGKYVLFEISKDEISEDDLGKVMYNVNETTYSILCPYANANTVPQKRLLNVVRSVDRNTYTMMHGDIDNFIIKEDDTIIDENGNTCFDFVL